MEEVQLVRLPPRPHKFMRPRPYLSFSQMTTFEMSPEKYANEYLYGEKRRISRNMAYGSMLAEGLEREESNGDPLLDLMAARLPKFEIMDLPVIAKKGMGVMIQFARGKGFNVMYVPILKNKGDDIPLLAIPDTAKADYSAFKEYKTSTQKWTQKRADDSGQITFYATAIWLATGKVPQDIELVNVPVAYQDDGRLAPTGELVRLPTQRTMTDIIKMTSRMRTAWAGIKKLCEAELL